MKVLPNHEEVLCSCLLEMISLCEVTLPAQETKQSSKALAQHIEGCVFSPQL